MQKHQEDVALIEEELNINDEKGTTGAASMAAQQVAESQRELVDQAVISYLSLTVSRNLGWTNK